MTMVYLVLNMDNYSCTINMVCKYETYKRYQLIHVKANNKIYPDNVKHTPLP